MGFWKIDKIAGYMPPWEAFLEFGIYQDFYLVYWQHPFQHVDYCSTENGSCAMAGSYELGPEDSHSFLFMFHESPQTTEELISCTGI